VESRLTNSTFALSAVEASEVRAAFAGGSCAAPGQATLQESPPRSLRVGRTWADVREALECGGPKNGESRVSHRSLLRDRHRRPGQPLIGASRPDPVHRCPPRSQVPAPLPGARPAPRCPPRSQVPAPLTGGDPASGMRLPVAAKLILHDRSPGARSCVPLRVPTPGPEEFTKKKPPQDTRLPLRSSLNERPTKSAQRTCGSSRPCRSSTSTGLTSRCRELETKTHHSRGAPQDRVAAGRER
jgi:hypothetical protein